MGSYELKYATNALMLWASLSPAERKALEGTINRVKSIVELKTVLEPYDASVEHGPFRISYSVEPVASIFRILDVERINE